MKNTLSTFLLLLTTSLFVTTAHAEKVNFDLLAASPVGSWQVREDIVTDAKGRQTGTTIRTSMLGAEERNGETHYWIEIGIDSFKVNKKGQRKADGDRAIIKSLIPKSTMVGDPANVLSNLRGFGIETIMQSGNDKPMRMGNSQNMMSGMMAAFNTEIKYDFTDQGTETVTVPAGDFSTRKINGQGSVSMKVVFKKINVESDSTMWLSSKVPFGTVKTEGTSTTNGKQDSFSSALLEYGMSGAKSEITGEPEDLPEMPNLGELFGK